MQRKTLAGLITMAAIAGGSYFCTPLNAGPITVTETTSNSGLQSRYLNTLRVEFQGREDCANMEEAYGKNGFGSALRPRVREQVRGAGFEDWHFYTPDSTYNEVGNKAYIHIGRIKGVEVTSTDPASKPALQKLGEKLLESACLDPDAETLAQRAKEAGKKGVTFGYEDHVHGNGSIGTLSPFVYIALSENPQCQKLKEVYGEQAAPQLLLQKLKSDEKVPGFFGYNGKGENDPNPETEPVRIERRGFLSNLWGLVTGDLKTPLNKSTAEQLLNNGSKVLAVEAGSVEIGQKTYLGWFEPSDAHATDTKPKAIQYGTELADRVCTVAPQARK